MRDLLSGACAFCCVCALLFPAQALAYRPFDSTDASVADAGELEVELGPLGHLKEGSAKSLVMPSVVANYGLGGDREIVLEGKLLRARGDLEPGTARITMVDNAVSLKQVLRRGVLQDGAGMSLAAECGILLPGIRADHGTGAGCALIASHRWSAATIHLNGAMAFDREHRWNRFAGLIIEGPFDWSVRPVAEVFAENEVNGTHTRSALVGLIWRTRETLSFDVGVRYARTDDMDVRQIRAGLTCTIAAPK